MQLSREDSSVSFERLLSAADSESASEKLSANEMKLYKQLKAGMKKIEHLTELLRESEASSVRLGGQAKLLKEEIRRCGFVCVVRMRNLSKLHVHV